MKVLHILYQSLPQISGSSIRSRDILMSQKEIGLNPIAVTSPFQSGTNNEEIIDGIRYLRTSINGSETISDEQKSLLTRIFRFFKILSFYQNLKQIVNAEKPDVLHAHAMFVCGLPAILIGKKYNIPVVYEVRSLWMLKKKGKKGWMDLLTEKILFGIELYVMRKAALVVAINHYLKNELIIQKIDEAKIAVIQNAVNTTLIDTLKQKTRNHCLSEPKLKFGYIGTLTPHEGVDFLIEVFANLNKEICNAELYIFGKGVEEPKIRAMSEKFENVTFKGSLEPENIHKAFELINIIVNPRYKNKLTDSVTPLKPLEAMAYEKIVIGSDVEGIKELITDKFNGLLFEAGNPSDLLNVMKYALKIESETRRHLLKNALQYVYDEKSWLKNATKYQLIYTELLMNKNAN